MERPCVGDFFLTLVENTNQRLETKAPNKSWLSLSGFKWTVYWLLISFLFTVHAQIMTSLVVMNWTERHRRQPPSPSPSPLYVAIQNNASADLGNIPLCSLIISNPIQSTPNTIRSFIIISPRHVSVILYPLPDDCRMNDRNMSLRNNNERMYSVGVLCLCGLHYCWLEVQQKNWILIDLYVKFIASCTYT